MQLISAIKTVFLVFIFSLTHPYNLAYAEQVSAVSLPSLAKLLWVLPVILAVVYVVICIRRVYRVK
ncbi:hypothetical protein [Moritella sp. Urea-trap-13]|uniref:hypothetical protein n=1 Tax=Moritella sp. Urea-trap-13 TaxID=2058327 RepID=UPI000C31C9E2|nr:hypothetical protein [Moritella sp. Urea-trap-13]PKH08088.1 hypothetical protein CXF93_05265 [Moritella sp. Urea-trap-13]